MIIKKFELNDDETGITYKFELAKNKATVNNGIQDTEIPVYLYHLIKKLYDQKETILDRAFGLEKVVKNYLDKDFLSGTHSISEEE